jgi:hypothetical protein
MYVANSKWKNSKSGAKLGNFCGFLMRIRGNLGFVLFENGRINFWSRKIWHFQEVWSRFPLQSYKSRPKRRGLQGFPLQSGLKEEILLFYHHSKKGI